MDKKQETNGKSKSKPVKLLLYGMMIISPIFIYPIQLPYIVMTRHFVGAY